MTSVRRRLPKATIVLALAFALALTAVEAVWVSGLVHPNSAQYLGSKKIGNTDSALTTAKRNLNAIVSRRHGVEAADSRCYFQDLGDDKSGHDQVSTAIWCGPVLFIADDPTEDYLQFTFHTVGPTFRGLTSIQVDSDPQRQTPTALTDSARLRRPDGTTPKTRERLAPPPTPAGNKDLFVKTDFVATLPPRPALPPEMGSINGGISLVTWGQTSSYGAEDATRRAADGQKLIVFTTRGSAGNDGTTKDLSAQAVVTVDHGTPRAVPSGAGMFYVVAVPTTATAVDLELHDGALNQSISLLDGKPAATNVSVLGRQDRYVPKNATTYPTSFNYSPAVVFPDGVDGSTAAATVSLSYGTLQYQETFGTTTITASGTSKAVLVLGVGYNEDHHSGGPYEMSPAFVTFTPTGGTALPVRQLDNGDKAKTVVEVPGNITGGTINVGGTVTLPYANGGGTYSVTVNAVNIPVTFGP